MRSLALLLAVISLGLPGCIDDACDGEDCHDDDGALFEQAYEDAQGEGKADGTDCSGVRVPDRGGFNKRIALTFDDGPNPETTPAVIEVLQRHHAPAAFFTNGSRYSSPAAVALAAKIAAEPSFLLANHSQGHLDLARQTAAKVASEIDRTDALIRAAGETPRYFRFPFGSSSCATKQAATSRGYVVTGWHIDSADWCYAAGNGYCKPSTFRYVPDEMRRDMKAYVLSQVRATNGGIILFHDIHRATAEQLDGVLTMLEQHGFSFVRIDDASVFPKLNGAAPPAAKFIGDRCTTHADCGFTTSGKAGRCHAAGFCTIECAGSCPDLAGKAPTFCIRDRAVTSREAGLCVSKAAPQNQSCELLPGTSLRVEARFLGQSGASPATANVCAPR